MEREMEDELDSDDLADEDFGAQEQSNTPAAGDTLGDDMPATNDDHDLEEE